MSEKGISTDTEKVQAVKGLPTPKTVNEIRSFLLLKIYTEFCSNCKTITSTD